MITDFALIAIVTAKIARWWEVWRPAVRAMVIGNPAFQASAHGIGRTADMIAVPDGS